MKQQATYHKNKNSLILW